MSSILQSIASSILTARNIQYHDWCNKVRYRNNGFLELVCVWGMVYVRVGTAHVPRANSVIVTRTHSLQTRLRCKCKDQFKMYIVIIYIRYQWWSSCSP